jgi:hypothetical protein
MLEFGLEIWIVIVLLVLWFPHAWYLNLRLKQANKKLDRLQQAFEGLREYLYEIDPQFDDERRSQHDFEYNEAIFSGMKETELQRRKRQAGKRTLVTPFAK